MNYGTIIKSTLGERRYKHSQYPTWEAVICVHDIDDTQKYVRLHKLLFTDAGPTNAYHELQTIGWDGVDFATLNTLIGKRVLFYGNVYRRPGPGGLYHVDSPTAFKPAPDILPEKVPMLEIVDSAKSRVYTERKVLLAQPAGTIFRAEDADHTFYGIILRTNGPVSRPTGMPLTFIYNLATGLEIHETRFANVAYVKAALTIKE